MKFDNTDIDKIAALLEKAKPGTVEHKAYTAALNNVKRFVELGLDRKTGKAA